MDILDMAKVLLGISKEDNSKDELLLIYVDSVMQGILNYCNISIFPRELELRAASMVADSYREYSRANVESISEGGRTVKFDFKAYIDNKITGLTELGKFKQLYKTG